MDEQQSKRINDLERRVDVLTNLVRFQLVLLGVLTSLVISQLVFFGAQSLRLIPMAAFIAVLLIPILVFTHRKLPTLARKFGHMCGLLFSSSGSTTVRDTSTAGDRSQP